MPHFASYLWNATTGRTYNDSISFSPAQSSTVLPSETVNGVVKTLSFRPTQRGLYRAAVTLEVISTTTAGTVAPEFRYIDDSARRTVQSVNTVSLTNNTVAKGMTNFLSSDVFQLRGPRTVNNVPFISGVATYTSGSHPLTTTALAGTVVGEELNADVFSAPVRVTSVTYGGSGEVASITLDSAPIATKNATVKIETPFDVYLTTASLSGLTGVVKMYLTVIGV